MTYGLQITGTDGSTVFSVIDTDENPSNYVVVATGTGSSVDIASSAYGGAGGEARLFFEPIGDVTTADVSGTTYNFKKYATTEDGNSNKTDATVTTQSVNWIILKDSANAPVNTSINDYGVQIFKSDGTSLSFDSTRLNTNESFRVLGVEGIRNIYGDDQDANATVGSGFSNTSYYVEATNLYYEDNGTSGEVHGFSVVGSPTQFLRHAFYVWSYTGGGGRQDITRYYSNPFPIVYGELR